MSQRRASPATDPLCRQDRFISKRLLTLLHRKICEAIGTKRIRNLGRGIAAV